MQKVETSDRCIRRRAQKQAQKFCQIPPVVDEWKAYQDQEIPEECKRHETRSTRFDHYWAKVSQMENFTGTEMFLRLMKLIKAVLTLSLSLSHGNADIERNLSVNKQTTGTNTTLLTPESLNGIRQVKDAVAAEDPPTIELENVKTYSSHREWRLWTMIQNSQQEYKINPLESVN